MPTTFVTAHNPLTKVTLRLYAHDVELLRQAFPIHGYNEEIRRVISLHVRSKIKPKLAKLAKTGSHSATAGPERVAPLDAAEAPDAPWVSRGASPASGQEIPDDGGSHQ